MPLDLETGDDAVSLKSDNEVKGLQMFYYYFFLVICDIPSNNFFLF